MVDKIEFSKEGLCHELCYVTFFSYLFRRLHRQSPFHWTDMFYLRQSNVLFAKSKDKKNNDVREDISS
jgi:hypothetical protein